ncbi:hypothetical protein D3C72_1490940 [compost metagenome]
MLLAGKRLGTTNRSDDLAISDTGVKSLATSYGMRLYRLGDWISAVIASRMV